MDLGDRTASGYVLDFEDRFEEDSLAPDRWLPHYLAHWSSRDAAAARYRLSRGALHLLIEEDQRPWCPEWDGTTLVSSLQTGSFSGAQGTRVGQHHFRSDLVVREEQPALRLYTPRYGVVAARARTDAHPDCMVSLWMIGYEDEPERSGEICVFEIFGTETTEDSTLVGMGIHPFGDPRLTDDFEKVPLAIDVREFHDYAVEWTPDWVSFFVDGQRVRSVEQSPGYPMQLMLGIYQFSPTEESPGRYPRRFSIDWIRGYRPADDG